MKRIIVLMLLIMSGSALADNLRLNYPNGGEKFGAGGDVNITWEGVSPNDTVKLDYSLDNGSSWKLITDKATGLSYNWKNIPICNMANCLISVSMLPKNVNSSDSAYWHSMDGVEQIMNYPYFSPDGSKILIGGLYSLIEIWDAQTGKIISKFDLKNRLESELCWSPDSKKIAAISEDGFLKIWSSESGATLDSLALKVYFDNYISWSPDGKKIAAVIDRDSIVICDAETCSRIIAFEGAFNINSVCWNNLSNKIATSSKNGKIEIWNVDLGFKIRTMNHPGNVLKVEWSSDGSKIASRADDASVKIWDASNGTEIRKLTPTEIGEDIKWSPDASKLAISSQTKHIIFWDVQTNSYSSFNGFDKFGAAGHISWGKDGKNIVTSADGSTVRIIDCITQEYKIIKTKYDSWINGLAWSPDGTEVATAGNDGAVIIWNVKNQTISHRIKEFSTSAVSAVWNNEGTNLVILKNYDFQIWDLKTRNKILTVADAKGKFNILKLSPDGTQLAVGCLDSTLRFYDYKSGNEIKRFKINSGVITAMSWCPDGTRIALAFTDSNVRIVKSDDGTITHKFYLQTYYTPNIFWNIPNSQLITNVNGKIKKWDLNSGELLQTFKSIDNNSGFGVADLNPEGTCLALVNGSSDGTKVAVMDLENGVIVRKLYSNYYYSGVFIKWSPDGENIASGGSREGVTVWKSKMTGLQLDCSDATFAIELPQIELKDIDMQSGIIECVKEVEFTDFIQNTGLYTCRIDSISFAGEDAKAFSVISETPKYQTPSGENKTTEFRFIPNRAGEHFSTIVVYTQSDTLYASIKGVGVNSPIEVVNSIIDFGVLKKNDKAVRDVELFSNTGFDELFINKAYIEGPNKDCFILNNLALPFDLKYSNSLTTNLSVIANTVGKIRARLVFEFDGFPYKAEFALQAMVADNSTGVFDNNDLAKKNLVNIAPNPAKDKITVTANVSESGTTLRVIDLLGKVFSEIECSVDNAKAQDFIIDLTNVPAGMYFIEFKSPNFSQVEKVVVEK